MAAVSSSMSADAPVAPVTGLRDLRVRAVAGVALAMVTLLALVLGGMIWWAMVALVSFGMLVEWTDLAVAGQVRRGVALAGLVAGLLLALPFVWGAERSTVAAVVGLGLLVAVLTNRGRLGFGVAYAGLPAVALLFLQARPDGLALAFWTLAIVWATDIGAYFAGRAIGGPLLVPRISPRKTWAGLAGGCVAALLVGAGLALVCGLPRGCVWLGAPLAVVAQLGDIYESALKRQAGVKDSGRLLPGHGGLLDRLDGLVPVAVLVAALVANGNLAG